MPLIAGSQTIGPLQDIRYIATCVLRGAWRGGIQVYQPVVKLFAIITLAALAAASAAAGDDDFSLIGTYTENQPCKADDSDPSVAHVKITETQIDSVFGLCTILETKHEGKTYLMHVECPGPGGSQMLGDISFSLREDKTLDFSDQDQTYKAVLYKCP
jgi:hypothetical protein